MNMVPTPTRVKIGPADNGRRMSLAEFEHAEVVEGRIYELGRGVIVVSDVPNAFHLALFTEVRWQIDGYHRNQRKRIYTVAGGAECKILLDDLESERHPDLAVYKTAPPGQDADIWAYWIPEIVVEIVSPGSEDAITWRNAKNTCVLACKNTGSWMVPAARLWS